MLGFGWCHLQSSREPLRTATIDRGTEVDASIAAADARLFAEFRAWMADHCDPWLQWSLFEDLNNHHGLLNFCLSRNHRTSSVWAMLEWIRIHAPGSYGLFYCHDDEDTMGRGRHDRNPPMDFDNVFRVHRLKLGVLEELPDPFLGQIQGDLEPVHPDERVLSDEVAGASHISS
ncbi:Imm7 family immunity protein [Verrucomicrobium sp. BvORR034]|uniref:Imm7 family immunity protein n=1 Tax=Verrucomicrobium sp. BvORR034 TaxID=1396418 RepID=UPI0031B5F45A